MLETMNFTKNDYGKTMNVSVWGFPGAVLIKTTEHITPPSKPLLPRDIFLPKISKCPKADLDIKIDVWREF